MKIVSFRRTLICLIIGFLGSLSSIQANVRPLLYPLNDRTYTISEGHLTPFGTESPEVQAVYFEIDSAELSQYHLQISHVEGKIAVFCNGRLIELAEIQKDNSLIIRNEKLPSGIGSRWSMMVFDPKGKLNGSIQLGLVSKDIQIKTLVKNDPVPRNTGFRNRNLRIILIWSSLFLSLVVIRKDPSLLLESLFPVRFLTNNAIKELSLARIFQWSENILLLLVIVLQVVLIALIKSADSNLIEVIQLGISLMIMFSVRFLIIPIASALFEMGRLANLHMTYALRTMSVLFVVFTTVYLVADLVLNIDQQAMANLQSGLIIFFTFAMVANIFSTLLRSYAQINLRFISYICAAELLPMLYLVQFL